VKAFEDPGISGSEIDQRPGFMALLRFCEERAEAGDPVQAVVCWDGERLSRADSIRTAACVARLVEAGVSRMLTVEGWIDWRNEIDRVLFNLKQDLSRAAYSKSIAKNVARSFVQRALRGEWLGSRPPHGYVRGPDGKLALGDPAKIAVVKRIFQEYAYSAASAAEIAAALNADGIPRRRVSAGPATRCCRSWGTAATWGKLAPGTRTRASITGSAARAPPRPATWPPARPTGGAGSSATSPARRTTPAK
jgi:DNA invertase Pin-like site-specific DNA recombinase